LNPFAEYAEKGRNPPSGALSCTRTAALVVIVAVPWHPLESIGALVGIRPCRALSDRLSEPVGGIGGLKEFGFDSLDRYGVKILRLQNPKSGKR
jgi:hypothetical protein